MSLTLPNIAPYQYLPAIKDISTGKTTYIVTELTPPESIEEALGISEYFPDGKWWEENYPLLSLTQQNKVATLPSILAGETVSTSLDVLELFEQYTDNNVNFAGLLSAVSGRNIIGYIASALGYSISEKSYEQIADFWDNVSKALFGDLRDKDIKSPILIKDGKTYVPKKLIEKSRKAMADAGLASIEIDFPSVDVGDYAIKSLSNTWSLFEKALLQNGIRIGTITYTDPSYETLFTEFMEYNGGFGECIIRDMNSTSYYEFECAIWKYTPELPYNVTVVNYSGSGYNYNGIRQEFKPFSSFGVSGFLQRNYNDSTGEYEWNLHVNSASEHNYNSGVHVFSIGSYENTAGAYKYTAFSNIDVKAVGGLPTLNPTGDIAEVTIPLEKAYPAWAKNAIGYPARVGTDEKEEWYPLTIPDAIPWTDGYTGTQEKAQEGELADERTTTRDEVLDNSIPDAITKPDIKTDVRPNPIPTPLPTIPTNVPSVDLGLAQLYNPTLSQLKNFSRWLWGVDFDIDLLKKLFADPMQAIIGLHAIYVSPTEGGTANIQVGYINSGVSSQVVKEQFTTINCGTIHIPEYFGDVRDYSPYTKVNIYLPFIGIEELNTDDIMGADVTVTYKIDVLTGACIALISVKSKYVNGILYSYSGNCAIQLPISAGGYAQTIASLLGSVSSAVAGGVVGGIGGAITGAVSSLGGVQKTSVTVSGALSGNSGAMGVKKPFITIRRPQKADAARYSDFYGYPANTYIVLSQVSGFCRIKDINLSVSGATADEQTEIVSLLKEGVIL